MREKKELVNVEEFSKAGKPVPADKRYRIKIDKEHYDVDVPAMTGGELLTLAHKTPLDRWDIYEKLHGGATRKIEHDALADFTAPGVEKFMTLPLDQTEG